MSKTHLIIALGSINLVKIQAAEEAIAECAHFAHAQILPIAVPSEIAEQPLSLQETIQGAKNRARNAFEACSCSYGFGVESGLCEAPGTQTGFLNVCVCCIFNGTDYHMGISRGFEVPAPILALILDQKLNLSQACYESGITDNINIGAAEGLIGILTKGKVDRKQYTKESIATALIQLENKEWYLDRS